MEYATVQLSSYSGFDDHLMHEVKDFTSSLDRSLGIDTCLSTDCSLNQVVGVPSLFLARRGTELIGVSTIFSSDPQVAEIAIGVQPHAWHRGIGSSLLSLVLRILEEYRVPRRLLICDRASSSGLHFALRHAKGLHVSEYAMRLARPVPIIRCTEPVVRSARMSDLDAMAGISASAFKDDEDRSRLLIEASMTSPVRTGYVGLVEGEPMAMCFVSDEDDRRSLNTIAVSPAWQGKGYAKRFLVQVIASLPHDGKPLVLDVDSLNERALELYRRLGFEIVKEIGYYDV